MEGKAPADHLTRVGINPEQVREFVADVDRMGSVFDAFCNFAFCDDWTCQSEYVNAGLVAVELMNAYYKKSVGEAIIKSDSDVDGAIGGSALLSRVATLGLVAMALGVDPGDLCEALDGYNGNGGPLGPARLMEAIEQSRLDRAEAAQSP